MKNWNSNSYTCSHCGGNEYDIVMTLDGYKEYRCKHCGSILYRVNLLEEYKKFDVNHYPLTDSTNIDELKEVIAKYDEDVKAVSNYINYLSFEFIEMVSDEDLDIVNKLINELTDVRKKSLQAKRYYEEELSKLIQETKYQELKTQAMKSYDPNKHYFRKSYDPSINWYKAKYSRKYTKKEKIELAICFTIIGLFIAGFISLICIFGVNNIVY